MAYAISFFVHEFLQASGRAERHELREFCRTNGAVKTAPPFSKEAI